MKKIASIKAEMSLSIVVLSMRISEYSFPQQHCFQLPLAVQANYALSGLRRLLLQHFYVYCLAFCIVKQYDPAQH